MTSNLGSKWLQYIYSLISQEVSPNIFLEKSFKKSAEETSPRPWYKKSLLSISLDQQSEILYSFLFYVQFKDYQNILKLRCWPLAFTSYKALLLKKKQIRLKLVSVAYCLHEFWWKIFLEFHCLYYLIYWQYVYCNYLFPNSRRHRF